MNKLYKGEPLVKEIIKDLYTQVYLNLLMGGLASKALNGVFTR